MQKKLKLAVMALCYAPLAVAQSTEPKTQDEQPVEQSAFTFTEAQLGQDEDMSQNVTILNSNSNAYASGVGYLFSPVRFRYRAFNQKYNEVYINGAPMNDMESGQFRYSMVGGLNQQTRNVDFALPFEANGFAMTGMAGSNNYDFRAGSMAQGHRLTLSAANRNYTLRGMYTYGSGFNKKGWAVAANLTYRWANRGYVEGTFYNSLSYYFGVQKKWDNGHSLAVSTWGNPTERASQGAGTDETYWLANDRYYNPYWGYQNGKKRNSRIINDFAPSALATWDWDFNDNTRLTTTLFGKYSIYKSTRLNYNSPAENPQPDYWKNLPSSYYDVWDENDQYNRTDAAYDQWNLAYNHWTADKANRQINWDRLYYVNRIAAANGQDAPYYVEAKHNNSMMLMLSSALKHQIDRNKKIAAGFSLGQNQGRHYETMEDLLGGNFIHNSNYYAIGDYPSGSDATQYDLNTMGPNRTGKLVYEGDKFRYDYALMVKRANAWATYQETFGPLHYSVSAKIGYDNMYRKGYMRNGMFADFSYGRSKTADFLYGGGKFSGTLSMGRGNTLALGIGYEHRAPQVNTAFVSPEMNNDYVGNLKNERIFSSELSYQYNGARLHANISAYYSRMTNLTEWQNFYFDDEGSFTYVSMSNIGKHHYGLEAGLKYKLTSFLDAKLLGTISEAEYINNANVVYMTSANALYHSDVVATKGIKENGTPLTAASIGMSYHQGGWFIDLYGNYYNRIYLSYAPNKRYINWNSALQGISADSYVAPEQAKGHGGWMMDASIGKSIYLKHGSLSINLMFTNLLNNRNIVTGGYEQSRSSYTTIKNADGSVSMNNQRAYKFEPKKYYAYGTNGMLNIAYKF